MFKEETMKINDTYEFKKEYLKNPADLLASLEPAPGMHHVSLLKLCNTKGKSERGYSQWRTIGKDREGEKEKLRKLIPEGFLETKLERKFRRISFEVSKKPKRRS